MSKNKVVFLDRDGVIIEDIHLLTKKEEVAFIPGSILAIKNIKASGYLVVVITNQPVVARGMATEKDIEKIHQYIQDTLRKEADTEIDAYYYCPHHPNATLEKYRTNCDCRKPKAGLIFKAAREMNIDLERSYLVGDRVTDIVAGKNAGCRTILVETGKKDSDIIETDLKIDLSFSGDYQCRDLLDASKIILKRAEAGPV